MKKYSTLHTGIEPLIDQMNFLMECACTPAEKKALRTKLNKMDVLDIAKLLKSAIEQKG